MQRYETTVGIKAIKLYMPPTKTKLDVNAEEEKGRLAKELPPAPGTMTSVERYQQEWVQLLKGLDENQGRMQDLAFRGELKSSKFRSLYWALLLRVLNTDHRNWPQQREQQRKRYEKLKQEFMRNPHEIIVPDDNPLSQATQSVWNQYFNNQELFAVIRQDVVRTFPGVDFFRKDLIQNAMSNILFCYAREHPYMSYRQGMHEILAPILFVVYSDHQSLLHFKEIAQMQKINEELLDVLNPVYLEEDSYSIFSRLMSSIESYYRISSLVPVYPPPQYGHSAAMSKEVEVIGQLNFIRDKILAKEDLHLHNYFLKLDIPLHLFGIRWLRLLFGREFPLLDLLVLWDAIFADSDRFELPNYILVAMLIRIRDKLLLSDYTTCLTFLMRYPSHVDISLILRHALYMQMPKKFERPPNAFVYFTPTTNPNSGAQNSPHPSISSGSFQDTSSKRMNVVRRHSFQQEKQAQHSASSPPSHTAAKVEQQITQLQSINAEDAAALARLKSQPEAARIIMDGYLENSPELMRLELINAQTTISMTRSKLQAYMETVRKHIVKQQPPEEVAQALNGIDELVTLLDVKFMFPLHTRNRPQIDQALEANEKQRRTKTSVHSEPHIVKKQPTPGLGATESCVVPQLLEECARHSGQSDSLTNSGTHPLTKLDSSNNTTADTYYEVPDMSFMFNSARILGNLKEIELIPIASVENNVEPFSIGEQQQNRPGVLKSGSDRNNLPVVDPLRSLVDG